MVLVFVVLFKFTDALAGAMTAAVRRSDLGFTRDDYATIIKGVGFAATLLGGFAGGYVARAYPLSTSLWIGGILQALGEFRVLLAGGGWARSRVADVSPSRWRISPARSAR